MHSRHLPRRLGRYAPVAAALLGSAAFAGPAGAQGPPAGGAAAPAITIAYNTAEITTGDLSPTSASVKRGAATLATGTFDGDPAAAEVGGNSNHPAAGGLPEGGRGAIPPHLQHGAGGA